MKEEKPAKLNGCDSFRVWARPFREYTENFPPDVCVNKSFFSPSSARSKILMQGGRFDAPYGR